jgi:hypothetical protein
MPSTSAEMESAALARDIKDCEEAQPRWDAVWNHAVDAEKLVDPDRRNYYQAEVLTMITINLESNHALLEVAQALKDDDTGQHEKAQTEAAAALQALDAV